MDDNWQSIAAAFGQLLNLLVKHSDLYDNKLKNSVQSSDRRPSRSKDSSQSKQSKSKNRSSSKSRTNDEIPSNADEVHEVQSYVTSKVLKDALKTIRISDGGRKAKKGSSKQSLVRKTSSRKSDVKRKPSSSRKSDVEPKSSSAREGDVSKTSSRVEMGQVPHNIPMRDKSNAGVPQSPMQSPQRTVAKPNAYGPTQKRPTGRNLSHAYLKELQLAAEGHQIAQQELHPSDRPYSRFEVAKLSDGKYYPLKFFGPNQEIPLIHNRQTFDNRDIISEAMATMKVVLELVQNQTPPSEEDRAVVTNHLIRLACIYIHRKENLHLIGQELGN